MRLPESPERAAQALPSPPISPTSVSLSLGSGSPSPGPSTRRAQRQSQSESPIDRPGLIRSMSTRAQRRSVAGPSLSSIITGAADIILSPTTGTGDGTITPASVKAQRRQSSIAYFTPSSPSPWDTRPTSLSESERVVGRRERERESGAWGAGGSKRASVVSGRGSARESMCEVPVDGSEVREREPLTLVERHADLLHFIAQKERKCLELRDQLAIHEKELAELKRKWERIVNRGFTSTNDVHATPPSQLLNASLGGVALDGLKEGVRMIASGINEVIQDLEPERLEEKRVQNVSTPTTTAPKSKPTHAPRESDSSTSLSPSTRPGSISHFSTSSRSSIWESPTTSAEVGTGRGDKDAGTETVATAPSLSRAGSLNSRMYKRTSARSKERTATGPPSAFVSGLSPRATTVEFGEFVSSPAVSHTATKSTGSTSSSIPPADSSNSASWMDSMGKKLGELQHGQVFSKSQKRASSLLAGVSHSIASALLPGPTPTTPAVSSLASRISSASTMPSKGTENWLDEDEEQTKHAGDVMTPVLVSSTSTKSRTGKACKPNAVSSFDDDDWNW